MLFHPISNFIKPGPNVIKLFTGVSYEFSSKARVFAPGKPFQPSILFAGNIGDDISIKSKNVKLNINDVCNLISVSSERFN